MHMHRAEVAMLSANLASAVAACMPQTRAVNPQSESVAADADIWVKPCIARTLRPPPAFLGSGRAGAVPWQHQPRRKTAQPGLR